MRRNDWTFDHPAHELLLAARRKVDHHRERRAHWEAQRIAWMGKIKEEGLEVHDEGGDFPILTSGVGRRRAPDVTVNAELKRQVAECHEKVLAHTDRLQGYLAWIQVLEAHPDHVLPLQHDDWLYFFGS
jgi:hypothetical protein